MSKLTNCIIHKDPSCTPVWFMRQAGRYLPEFRKIRLQNKNFIKLCLDSNLSSEITLQPLKRFELDAAIIFSDILMVPYGLGQEVKFEKNKGPILSEFNLNNFLNNDKKIFTKKLNPVYEAIRQTRHKLDKNKSLISFVGAPWTLAIYMLGLKKNKDKINLVKLKKKKKELKFITEKLNEYLCLHIENQINAGADTVQIFDSWAGLIPNEILYDHCYIPNKKIVEFCKEKKAPVICFPRGINKKYLEFAKIVKPNCLNLDYRIDPMWAKENLKNFCLQGGMDPNILFKSENEIFKEVDKYLTIFKDTPYIFNLGHGLLPKTNPDTLKKVIDRVNNFR
ncbi:MAG: uroporphyrinogen decarboxylase [Pelagibacterales bacterium]|nr:uroporphyrinogen decarboxylase [Pelagibacterales bacterium]|tara:strand:+ start:5774 stop:6784 length:1011 start_codon:yes stop_codon:yes gene_type:complete